MEKSEKYLKQCHKRTKVSNSKIVTNTSVLRMPRVRDGKSIARPKLCVTLEGLRDIRSIYLALLITILALANCKLAYGSFENVDFDGVAPLTVLKPLNLMTNLLAEENVNNSNTETNILKELKLPETETRQVRIQYHVFQ